MLNFCRILLSKYRAALKNWRHRTPKQKFNVLFNIGRVMSEMIGLRVYSDMKIYWYTGSCGILCLLNYAMTFYTIQYYFRRNEFVRGMECTCFIGITTCVRCQFFKID